jgi:hypothetical protein
MIQPAADTGAAPIVGAAARPNGADEHSSLEDSDGDSDCSNDCEAEAHDRQDAAGDTGDVITTGASALTTDPPASANARACRTSHLSEQGASAAQLCSSNVRTHARADSSSRASLQSSPGSDLTNAITPDNDADEYTGEEARHEGKKKKG